MTTLMSVYQTLADRYGPLHWWPADTPFEVAVGAILTQNTNWGNVEKAIANLRIANALDCADICGMARPLLEEIIRPSGFFRQKAERLQLFCNHLHEHYRCSLEIMLQQPLASVRDELLRQKGIGPETADSILLYAGGHPSFVVDAYTSRLFGRLGILSGSEKYEEIQTFFSDRLAPEAPLFNEYHALIVQQCKEHCRKKPLCPSCPLENLCRYRHLNQ